LSTQAVTPRIVGIAHAKKSVSVFASRQLMQTIRDEPIGDTMKTNHSIAATALVAATLLAGCGSPQTGSLNGPGTPQNPTPTSAAISGFGVVESIQAVNTANTSSGGIGLGTVAGGVVGGVLGSQVGGGRGRDAATAAGVVGGAVIGHQMEKNRQVAAAPAYQVGVRLDNGTYQTIVQDTVADLTIGSRVRIENGRAYRY
jgi:outer membrane lipoprotein SlyB